MPAKESGTQIPSAWPANESGTQIPSAWPAKESGSQIENINEVSESDIGERSAGNGSDDQSADTDEETETMDQKTTISGENICKVITCLNKSKSYLFDT